MIETLVQRVSGFTLGDTIPRGIAGFGIKKRQAVRDNQMEVLKNPWAKETKAVIGRQSDVKNNGFSGPNSTLMRKGGGWRGGAKKCNILGETAVQSGQTQSFDILVEIGGVFRHFRSVSSSLSAKAVQNDHIDARLWPRQAVSRGYVASSQITESGDDPPYTRRDRSLHSLCCGCTTDGSWSMSHSGLGRFAVGPIRQNAQGRPGRRRAQVGDHRPTRSSPRIPFTGIEPLFHTIGVPEAVLFHRSAERNSSSAKGSSSNAAPTANWRRCCLRNWLK